MTSFDPKSVASSSALLLSYAFGGFLGPVFASSLMQLFGDNILFIYLALFNLFFAVIIMITYKYNDVIC